jgi:predicted dienelactone hydrolase
MGPVAENAELSGDQVKWPVVLLSHGTGGTAQGLGWLGRRLASKGFICIGVSHHGNTAIEPYLAEGFLCFWERASDLTTILDLLNQNGLLAGRLDMANVFASGFSLGGCTVLHLVGAVTSLSLFENWLATQRMDGGGPREFPDLASHIPVLNATSKQFRVSQNRHSRSYRDSRIKAVLAFAPAPPVRGFEPQSLGEISVPVSIMVGQSDREAPHRECALWLTENNAAFQIELLEKNVGHYVFLCEATELGKSLEPLLCVDAPDVSRRAIHDRAAAVSEALFRERISQGQ